MVTYSTPPQRNQGQPVKKPFFHKNHLTGKVPKKLAKNSEILLDKGGLLGYNKEADFGGAEII